VRTFYDGGKTFSSFTGEKKLSFIRFEMGSAVAFFSVLAFNLACSFSRDIVFSSYFLQRLGIISHYAVKNNITFSFR